MTSPLLNKKGRDRPNDLSRPGLRLRVAKGQTRFGPSVNAPQAHLLRRVPPSSRVVSFNDQLVLYQLVAYQLVNHHSSLTEQPKSARRMAAVIRSSAP